MKIKLHGVIVDAETKKWDLMWSDESDLVTFKDLDEALAKKPNDDKTIELDINCPGGSCIEGFAIYDKLRSLEGHTIKAEIIGECSSMATIVLLAASVRKIHPNARICIHKPRYDYLFLDTVTEDEALKIYSDLHAETERLKKIYLERTSYTEQELESLMSEDRYMTAEEALKHGVVTEIIKPMTAIKINQTTSNMKLTKAQKFKLKAVGLGDLIEKIEAVEDKTIVSMTLNTEDGGTIEVEREEGDPQVGDAASPDGEHLMSDGTTIVITDGVITEIRPAEEQTGTEDTMTSEEVEATIATMSETIEALTAENEDLKKQLESSKSNEKTAEDVEVLSLVTNAGGLKWLKSLKTNHKPSPRDTNKGELSNVEANLQSVRKAYDEAKKKKLNK